MSQASVTTTAGIDTIAARDVAAKAASSAADTALRDLLSLLVCFLWLAAGTTALGQWGPVAETSVGRVLAASGRLSASILGVEHVAFYHAALFHSTCAIFRRLPCVLQGLVWLAASVVGLVVSGVLIDVVARAWSTASIGARNASSLIGIGVASILFYLAIGLSALRSFRAQALRGSSFWSSLLGLVGVPRVALQAQRRHISNVLEWLGGGTLHGGLIGGVIVAVFGRTVIYMLAVAGLIKADPWPAQFEPFEAGAFVLGSLLLGATLKLAAHRGLAANSADLGYKIEHPDVLYLRPFAIDNRDVSPRGNPLLNLFFPRREQAKSIEQVLLKSVPSAMTISAIGQPEGEAAAVGATRTFSARASWEDLVQNGMEKAGTVVLIADASPGIAWEIEQVVRKRVQSKTALVFQPNSDRAESIRLIQNVFGAEVGTLAPNEKPLMAHATATGTRVLMGKHLNEFEYSVAFSAFFDRTPK